MDTPRDKVTWPSQSMRDVVTPCDEVTWPSQSCEDVIVKVVLGTGVIYVRFLCYICSFDYRRQISSVTFAKSCPSSRSADVSQSTPSVLVNIFYTFHYLIVLLT